MIKGRYFYLFLNLLGSLIFCLYLSVPVIAADTTFQLTQEEQAWIKAHPQIIVANETDWPPFDFTVDGQPAGLSIDMVQLIARKTGLKAKFINGFTWKELMQLFKEGKIDLLPALFVNDERQKFISFSDSYYSQPSVMVVHEKNQDIVKIEDLAGKRVAGVKSYSFTSAIKRIMPTATMVEVSSILEGVKAVSLGKADAFIDSIGTISYLLDNNFIPNIKIISEIEHPDLDSPAIHMGVAKNNIVLTGILNKALASISRDEKRELAKTWFHQTEKQKSLLSPEQKQWLSQHPKIRIGIMNAWPPMDYVDAKGMPQGIGVKFIDALNKRLGNRLEIVPGLFRDNFNSVKEKKLDALMDITPREDRKKFVHFTRPYIEVPHLIFTRKDESAKSSLSELEGKTVGVEKGFFIVKVLQEKYPKTKVKEYLTTSDALDALSKSEVDAYIGNRAVANYIIENELISNVIAQGKIKETSSINAIGVRKDWAVLRDIIQKAIDDIDDAERSNIINPKSEINQLSEIKTKLFQKLTNEERDWLNKKLAIHLGVDSAWPPIEWIDEKGEYQGITSDYIKILGDVLGLNFIKPENIAWSKVINSAEQKKIDVLTAVVATPKRKKFLNFTSPYLKFPLVIFAQDNISLITELSDIYGKRVGVEKGYSSEEILNSEHPQINLVPYQTTKEILYALSVGDIDAYVGNLTVGAYLLNKEGLTNIKVVAPTPYSFDISLGVRKDWPELQSILQKTLPLIDEVQRNNIRQHWLKLNYKVGIDSALVIKVAIVAFVILILILLWIFIIQYQKKVLSVAKEETDRANAKLKELDQLKSMFIASVSHELRTPLNAVIGFSSIMKSGLYGELSEKYQDYSVRIHKSGQHLLSLITDIIDISKIESGNLDIEISDFEFNEIIEESVVSLQELADSKGIRINVNVPENIILTTDKRRLYQTILNFLSNALKYSEEGEVTIDVIENGATLTCSISDTGVGISEEDMERLFTPFERFESSIKVKAGGTGLGLYLTNKIVVEMLQGEIGAESKLGKGSTFWLKIPKVISTHNLEEDK